MGSEMCIRDRPGRGFGHHWGPGDAREGRREPRPDSTSDDFDEFYGKHRDGNKPREPGDKRGRPKRRQTRDYTYQGNAAGQWQARTPGQARRPASPPASPDEVRRTPAQEPDPWIAGTGAGLRQQEAGRLPPPQPATLEFQLGPGAERTRNPQQPKGCLLYTSPSPRDGLLSRMPSSA